MAGRTVGSIEIVVDANTGKLKAQIVRSAKTAGEAGGKALEDGLNDVDFKKLNARIKALRAQIQEQLAGIEADIGIDRDHVVADIEAIKQRLRDTEIAIRVNPQLGREEQDELIAQARESRAELERVLTFSAEGLVKFNLRQARQAAVRAEQTIGKIEAVVEAKLDDASLARARAEAEERRDIQWEIELEGAQEVQDQIAVLTASVPKAEMGIGLSQEDIADVFAELDAISSGVTAEMEVAVNEASKREAQLELEALGRDIKVQIGVGVDLGDILTAEEEIERELSRAKAKIDVELRVPRAQEALLQAEIDRMRLEARVDPEIRNRRLAEARMQAEMDRIRLEVATDPDLANARLAEVRLQAEMERIRLSVAVDPEINRLKLLLAKKEAEAELGNLRAKIDKFDVDDDALDKVGRTAGARFGDSFGKSAGRNISLRMQAIIAGIATLTGPAGVGLLGVAGDAVSVLSSAFSALGGSIGAATPIFAAFLGTTAAAVIGFSSLNNVFGAITKEFNNTVARTKEEQEALEKLGPAAVAAADAFDPFSKEILAAVEKMGPATRDFALQISELTPVFAGLRNQISDAVFADLADVLESISSTLLPDIGDALTILGGSFNTFLRDLIGAADQIDFSGLAEGIAPALNEVSEAVASLFQTIGVFFDAASPAAESLASSFRLTAEALGRMVAAGAESGAINEFLTLGLESLSEWADLLKEVGSALLTVFKAGRAEGDSLINRLTDIVARFNDWLQSTEGQTALLDFLKTADGILTDLIPVLKGVQGFFDKLITPEAVDAFGDLAQELGRALPFLGEFFELIGRTNILTTFVRLIADIGDALRPVLPAFQEFADVLGEALSDALDQIAPVLPDLARAFANLAEALTPAVADVVVTLAVAFTQLLQVLRPIIDFIARLPEPVLEVVVAFGALHKIMGPLEPLFKKVNGLFIAADGSARSLGKGLTEAFVNNRGLIALAGIEALVATAIIAFDNLGRKQREVAENSRAIGSAIAGAVNEIKNSTAAIDGQTSAWDVLGEQLLSTRDDADSIKSDLGALGLTMDQLGQIIFSLDDGGGKITETLIGIGKSLGLTDKEASAFAETVKDIDKNGTQMDLTIANLQAKLEDSNFAKAGGDIEAIVRAAEHLQDVGEDISFDKTFTEAINALAADETTKGLVEQAKALTEVNGVAADSQTIFFKVVELMNKEATAAGKATPPTEQLAEALKAMGAAGGEIKPILEENVTNFDAIAQILQDVATEAVRATNPIFQLGEELDAFRAKTDAAAQASETFKDILSRGPGRELDVLKSTNALNKAGLDLAKRFKDVNKADSDWTLSLDSTTESGNENIEMLTRFADEAQNVAASLIAAGRVDEARKEWDKARQVVEDIVKAFDITPDAAKKLLDAIGLTGEDFEFAISAVGVDDEKKKIDDMLEKIGQLSEGQIKLILSPETITAITQTQAYHDLLIGPDGLDNQTIDTFVNLFLTPEAQAALAALQTFKEENVVTLAGPLPVVIDISETGGDETLAVIFDIKRNAEEAAKAFADMQQQANIGLSVLFGGNFATGGFTGRRWGIGGEAGPELVTVGGRSAIINNPTILPPNTTVVPLTGDVKGAQVQPTNNITQNIVVNTVVEDPAIVAQQVMNRTVERLRF